MEREDDQAKAMEALLPVLPVIHEILEDAVAFYFGDGYSDEVRAEHSDRAMANCIYAHAEHRMSRAADNTDGLHTLRVRGLHVLNYRDRALTRFKKVKPNGKHSNYQTKQQQDYDDQLSFEGFPEPAYRVVAGYQLDDAGVGLERVMITRPLGRNVFWTAQVNMVDDVAHWEDITPKRFAGTGGVDFNAERAREKRG